MNLKLIMLNILYLVVTSAFGSRILAIVPTPSYSHQVAFQPLWKELSLRGHQLTVLTTDPINNASLTNLTEIDLHKSYQILNKININEVASFNVFRFAKTVLTFGQNTMEEQLSHPAVQELIHNETKHFDLLLVESIWPAATAFATRFKCPFIIISSLDVQPNIYNTLGNPTHPVLNPDCLLPFSGKLTFLERLTSTFFSLFSNYFHNVHAVPMFDLLVKKYFGDGYPYLSDIFNNMSMLFVNTDTILHPIRPLLPNVIQIGGGIHLEPPQPLPDYVQQFLSNASDGFIYFSLGSNVRSQNLVKSVRNILLETFADLPYKVLWKFEVENLPGKSANVLISKWFPQQDILRHPQIKLFITQGGLQSLEEGIYNYVPFIGIPFITDQASNVNRMVDKGLGLSLNYETLDKVSLKNAILEVIGNSNYRTKVKELAKLARDQPMTGLERAVWWTEYVIRHKGARHLRSPAADLPFYQYYLLDVIGFCFLSILLTIYVLLQLVKLLVKCLKQCTKRQKTKIH